jgi:hypothetical protein
VPELINDGPEFPDREGEQEGHCIDEYSHVFSPKDFQRVFLRYLLVNHHPGALNVREHRIGVITLVNAAIPNEPLFEEDCFAIVIPTGLDEMRERPLEIKEREPPFPKIAKRPDILHEARNPHIQIFLALADEYNIGGLLS